MNQWTLDNSAIFCSKPLVSPNPNLLCEGVTPLHHCTVRFLDGNSAWSVISASAQRGNFVDFTKAHEYVVRASETYP
jgi:hypothetical protein